MKTICCAIFAMVFVSCQEKPAETVLKINDYNISGISGMSNRKAEQYIGKEILITKNCIFFPDFTSYDTFCYDEMKIFNGVTGVDTLELKKGDQVAKKTKKTHIFGSTNSEKKFLFINKDSIVYSIDGVDFFCSFKKGNFKN